MAQQSLYFSIWVWDGRFQAFLVSWHWLFMKSRKKAIKHPHLIEDRNHSRRICHLLLDVVISRKVKCRIHSHVMPSVTPQRMQRSNRCHHQQLCLELLLREFQFSEHLKDQSQPADWSIQGKVLVQEQFNPWTKQGAPDQLVARLNNKDCICHTDRVIKNLTPILPARYGVFGKN